MDGLFASSEMRPPNVGANRHWVRQAQYRRELEDMTDRTPEGRGLALANIGGRGPVAREPRDPGKLAIRIKPSFLRDI